MFITADHLKFFQQLHSAFILRNYSATPSVIDQLKSYLGS